MSKRIVLFNHKGGVSKTTSTFHIGWKLAQNHRVLLVDGDPQCNLTSLILRDGFEDYYYNDETGRNNLKDGVAPAFSGQPIPIGSFEIPSAPRCTQLFLLPGHANLSELDASLTLAFTSSAALVTLQNLPGAFSRLISNLEERYNIDYTLIDLNPGLSAINQDFFLLSDAFIVPTNPDPFSLMAVRTLARVLPRWMAWKSENFEIFSDAVYRLPPGRPKFLGSMIQRFNVRNGQAARPNRNVIVQIKDAFCQDFIPALAEQNMALRPDEYGEDLIEAGYCLSEIPDFQGLLPMAHRNGVPVFALSDRELDATGPVRDNWMLRRNEFNVMFDGIAEDVVRLSRLA